MDALTELTVWLAAAAVAALPENMDDMKYTGL